MRCATSEKIAFSLPHSIGLHLPLSLGAGGAADEPPMTNLQDLLQLPELARLKLAGACGAPGDTPVPMLMDQLEYRWDVPFVGRQVQRQLQQQWHHVWRA